MKNKNKIKRFIAVIVQALVVFAPLMYFLSKKNPRNTFYENAYKYNITVLISIVLLVISSLIFVMFRNSFLHALFYALSFSLLWYYIYGLLDSLVNANKKDYELKYIDLDLN